LFCSSEIVMQGIENGTAGEIYYCTKKPSTMA
jgi:hypothetical protein